MNRKTPIYIFLVLILFSCKNDQIPVPDKNQEVIIKDETMLLGKIEKHHFQLPTYKDWFDESYESYQIQDSLVEFLQDQLNGSSIKSYLGSWCSDTQREIPSLFKILEKVNFPQDSITLIAVDRSKKNPKDYLEGINIKYVPTIIVSKAGKELGRIIETPNESLEADLIKILSQNKAN